MTHDSIKKFAPFLLAAVLGGVLATALSFKPKKIPKLTLYYFDIPGKGEATRLACAYGNIPLIDYRVKDSSVVLKLKADGVLPFGQLPILTVDDSDVIAQSAAIARYVGKLTGLYPEEDSILCAKIDALIDAENDLFMGLAASRYRERMGFGCLDSETVARVRKSLNDEVLPRHLRNFETILSKSESGWLAGGSKPSIADFIIVPRLQWLIEPGVHDGISTSILEPFPLILKLIKQFNEIPAVKKYYAK